METLYPELMIIQNETTTTIDDKPFSGSEANIKHEPDKSIIMATFHYSFHREGINFITRGGAGETRRDMMSCPVPSEAGNLICFVLGINGLVTEKIFWVRKF